MSAADTCSSAFSITHWITLRSPRGSSRIESPAASTAAFRVSDTGGLRLPIPDGLIRFAPPDGDEPRQNDRGNRRNQHPYEEFLVAQSHLDFAAHRPGNHEPQVHQRIGERVVRRLIFAGRDLL